MEKREMHGKMGASESLKQAVTECAQSLEPGKPTPIEGHPGFFATTEQLTDPNMMFIDSVKNNKDDILIYQKIS